MKYLLVFFLIFFALFKLGFFSQEISYGPGIVVADSPLQSTINFDPGFTHGDYTITPLAEFSLSARVLSKEYYRLDREADLSPVDLALGWGPMSDESILEAITISQSNRWYFWRVDSFPIPQREIEIHSANMHMIPADKNIKQILDTIQQGHVISLRGKLVSVEHADGYRWKSSLTRNDTGNGSCELIWVESVTIEL